MINNYRIVPQLTDVEHRSQCLTETKLGNFNLSVPLIVASMHSLVSQSMVQRVELAGSLVVQPRLNLNDWDNRFLCDRQAISVGLDDCLELAERMDYGSIISIEIANGYMRELGEKVKMVRKLRPDLYIMAGTICEENGAKYLSDCGANGILVGIGIGSACLTTKNTGVGLPLHIALPRVLSANLDNDIIVCGGVKCYGDVSICLGLGADFVMSGKLFSGCLDANSKIYYGETSRLNGKNNHIEGTQYITEESDKTSADVIQEMIEDLQSAMSYSDSFDLDEFRQKVKIERI